MLIDGIQEWLLLDCGRQAAHGAIAQIDQEGMELDK
jgi:hypothetical protein